MFDFNFNHLDLKLDLTFSNFNHRSEFDYEMAQYIYKMISNFQLYFFRQCSARLLFVNLPCPYPNLDLPNIMSGINPTVRRGQLKPLKRSWTELKMKDTIPRARNLDTDIVQQIFQFMHIKAILCTSSYAACELTEQCHSKERTTKRSGQRQQTG